MTDRFLNPHFEGNEPVESKTPKDFQLWLGNDWLTKFVSGVVDGNSLNDGEKVCGEVQEIIKRLKDLSGEEAFAIIKNIQNHDLFIQTESTKGTNGSINRKIHEPDGYVRVFDFHNHPSGDPFFSASDYRELLESWSVLLGQIAVSREGVCIALKTDQTVSAVKKFSTDSRLQPELAMEDLWDKTVRSIPDGRAAVKAFNIKFCQIIKARLIFVPAGSNVMEIMV